MLALLALLAVSTLAAPAAFAQTDGDEMVSRAVNYLDSLTTVKARFTQSNERGGEASGTVIFAKPGRARFQYDPPSTMLLTSDGRTVILSDSRLKSFQKFSLSSTPLAVFLADHIHLDRGAKVERVDVTHDGYSITARTSTGSEGRITLYFAERPMRLTGWEITDAQNHATRVVLGPFTPVEAPPADAFTQAKP
jgi:outer membrane lipoprotein-sorting protein